ncbi:zinc-binding dehydrogenase [Mumia zhuanghuii]|uniref:Zinc-binding dehydrogenase n=1 Tax=Mumia zhuanghuii TaxID=2585211 RepID=A0A5C4MDJ5_9ACTN|nr:zinc-binding dehydrogenase [Mumia zhuanghuii]TNC38648.1 zinc-binding dehydrogenase [Mumia zhuanghuii]TNC43260.1 zinc-binding dehydrogenase [Mumia zhuanghuii]
MRAVQVSRWGGPEVLEVVDLPVPEPGPGELRVAVTVADVIFLDTLLRGGAGAEWGIALPYVPGGALAGTVRTVGAGVDASWVGRRVMARTGTEGAAAEYAVAAADQAVLLDDDVTDDDAAALSRDGVTALGLLDVTRVGPGDRVLVNAAAGGAGALVVQAALARGATVVGAARGERKLALVRELGAEAVDYTLPGWTDKAVAALGGERPTVLLEGAGGTPGQEAFTVLADGGRLVAYGAAGGFLEPDPEEVRRRGLDAGGISRIQLGKDEVRARTVEALALLREGAWAPVIRQRYPLEDLPAAHRGLEERTAIAKTLISLVE